MLYSSLSTIGGAYLLLFALVDLESLAQAYFNAIMHQIWSSLKYSKYDNTPARLVVLTREICNTVTMPATCYVLAVFDDCAAQVVASCS